MSVRPSGKGMLKVDKGIRKLRKYNHCKYAFFEYTAEEMG